MNMMSHRDITKPVYQATTTNINAVSMDDYKVRPSLNKIGRKKNMAIL